jgi:hypothetical protein
MHITMPILAQYELNADRKRIAEKYRHLSRCGIRRNAYLERWQYFRAEIDDKERRKGAGKEEEAEVAAGDELWRHGTHVWQEGGPSRGSFYGWSGDFLF